MAISLGVYPIFRHTQMFMVIDSTGLPGSARQHRHLTPPYSSWRRIFGPEKCHVVRDETTTAIPKITLPMFQAYHRKNAYFSGLCQGISPQNMVYMEFPFSMMASDVLTHDLLSSVHGRTNNVVNQPESTATTSLSEEAFG